MSLASLDYVPIRCKGESLIGKVPQNPSLSNRSSAKSGAAEVGLAQLKVGLKVHHPCPGLEQQTLLFDVRGPLAAKVALQFQTAINYVPYFASIPLTFKQILEGFLPYRRFQDRFQFLH